MASPSSAKWGAPGWICCARCWNPGLCRGAQRAYGSTGTLVNPATNIPDSARPIKNAPMRIFGMHVRYGGRLFSRYDWQVALHVRNLFDDYLGSKQ